MVLLFMSPKHMVERPDIHILNKHTIKCLIGVEALSVVK